MPLLPRRGGFKLLRIVGGKPHARAVEDHEEVVKVERERGLEEDLGVEEEMATTRHWESEDDINADPISSSDEASAPAKQQTPPPPPPPASSAKSSNFPRLKALGASKPPGKRRSNRSGPIKTPAPGRYAQNQQEKRRRLGVQDEDEEKENADLGPSAQSMAGKGNVEPDDDRIDFGFAWSAPKRQKKTEYTKNIHALSGTTLKGNQKGYGTNVLRGHATSSKTLTAKKPKDFSRKTQLPTLEPPDDSDEDMEEIDESLLTKKKLAVDKKDREEEEEEEEIELLEVDLPPSKKKSKDTKSSSAKSAKPSILNTLANYRTDQTHTSSHPSGSQNTSLPNLDPYASGASTPLSSIDSTHPTETLHAVEQYLGDLPAETSESTDKCPLCSEPVDPSHYTSFWTYGKKKTVFYQTLFCKEHKRRKALKEYKVKGYPEIDWDAFTDKIKHYHPDLTAVLRNEKPSLYRDVHAQKLADRDQRTVRKLLDSDSLFKSTTGYYGSRGKRAMMEAIVSQLGPVIGECVERDPVVAFNGFANFVQGVLVPELTVWLVRDELECSEAKAREVVRESETLGEMVNDEVEDRVDVVESEDDSEAERERDFADEGYEDDE